MQTPIKPLNPILALIFTLITSLASSQPNSPYCGGFSLRPPLSFRGRLLCNSSELFFPASHGVLLRVSAIDYEAQRLTVTRPNDGREVEAEVPFRAVNRAPEICRECEMDGGNCSAPVMCLCHAKKCKERILNRSHRSTSSVAVSIVLAMATWMMRVAMPI